MASSWQMRRFRLDKRDRLTGQCRTCAVHQLCCSGCPKDRFAAPKEGEPGHNYLCEELKLFDHHTRPTMNAMAYLIRTVCAPAEILALVAAEDARCGQDCACICGSGRPHVACHGTPAAPAPD
jgi:uncharacterized protein